MSPIAAGGGVVSGLPDGGRRWWRYLTIAYGVFAAVGVVFWLCMTFLFDAEPTLATSGLSLWDRVLVHTAFQAHIFNGVLWASVVVPLVIAARAARGKMPGRGVVAAYVASVAVAAGAHVALVAAATQRGVFSTSGGTIVVENVLRSVVLWDAIMLAPAAALMLGAWVSRRGQRGSRAHSALDE